MAFRTGHEQVIVKAGCHRGEVVLKIDSWLAVILHDHGLMVMRNLLVTFIVADEGASMLWLASSTVSAAEDVRAEADGGRRTDMARADDRVRVQARLMSNERALRQVSAAQGT